jgi:serine/threonine protein kinase
MADGYIRGVALGEGTWGHVFEATRKVDGRKVAIKRIKPMDPHLGVNFTALREIKHLQEFQSPFIVDVRMHIEWSVLWNLLYCS